MTDEERYQQLTKQINRLARTRNGLSAKAEQCQKKIEVLWEERRVLLERVAPLERVYD